MEEGGGKERQILRTRRQIWFLKFWLVVYRLLTSLSFLLLPPFSNAVIPFQKTKIYRLRLLYLKYRLALLTVCPSLSQLFFRLGVCARCSSRRNAVDERLAGENCERWRKKNPKRRDHQLISYKTKQNKTKYRKEVWGVSKIISDGLLPRRRFVPESEI